MLDDDFDDSESIKGIKIKVLKRLGNKIEEETKQNCKNAIQILDENIIKYLEGNEFSLNIIDEKYMKQVTDKEYDHIERNIIKKIKKRFREKDIRAKYVWGRTNIYFLIQSDESTMIKVILHEIGHFLDYDDVMNIGFKDAEYAKDKGEKMHKSSKNEYFQKCYEKEKENYKKCNKEAHYKSSPQEFFAESFARYILKKSKIYNKVEFDMSKFENTIGYIEEFIENEKYRGKNNSSAS